MSKKPYLHFRTTPWLIIPSDDAYRYLYHDPEEFKRKIEEQQSAIKKAIDYRWGNSHLYIITPSRTLFTFLLYVDNGRCSLTIWDMNSICIFDGGGAVGSDEWHNKLDQAWERIKDAENGLYLCHDCNDLIEKDEIAGRYFASVFCDVCWETKWKAIEAKETYN